MSAMQIHYNIKHSCPIETTKLAPKCPDLKLAPKCLDLNWRQKCLDLEGGVARPFCRRREMSDVAVIRRQHRAVSVGAATSTLDAEEADERRPEGESDHAVDDEVDAGVEHEAEDVEAGQDPDGDG